MQKPLTSRGVSRLWKHIKDYVAENAYPKVDPPDLYFDSETATLYIGKSNIGYDFIVDNAILYYKERSV